MDAKEYYRKAAKHEDDWDEEEIMELYEKAAEQKYAPAYRPLSVFYQYGYGTLKEPEPERAEKLRSLADAAEAAWDTLSLEECIDFGRYYYNLRDGEETALQWFQRAAEQEGILDENADAEQLIQRYVHASDAPAEMAEEPGTEPADRRNISCVLLNDAMNLLDEAAKDGNCDAQKILAFCYEHGLGVCQNSELAKEYTEMAEGGNL